MMSEFDTKAREWDNDQRHVNRAAAVAAEIKKRIPLRPGMKALEYGSGTGLLSFELKDAFTEIVLMDNSQEMIRVCEEKSAYYQTPHIQPVWFDLEHKDYPAKFDIIYSLMVLHHVTDMDTLLHRFSGMLNPNGIMVIADLYEEDGSFHDFKEDVHKGFDPEQLLDVLEEKGFDRGQYVPCYQVKRPNGRDYPVFLLWAGKGALGH
ncbi:MAG: class I SAM-dependent methyltransferase [Bacteroidales bacterium]